MAAIKSLPGCTHTCGCNDCCANLSSRFWLKVAETAAPILACRELRSAGKCTTKVKIYIHTRSIQQRLERSKLNIYVIRQKAEHDVAVFVGGTVVI